MARQTKCTPELLQNVYNIAVQGCTDVDIYRGVGISHDTFYRWIKTKSEFSETLKRAEQDSNQLIRKESRKTLLKLVQGYFVNETTTDYAPTDDTDGYGNPMPKIKGQRTVRKYIPPNVTAVIFALTNTDPDNWHNRQSMDVTQRDVTPHLDIHVPDKETAIMLQRLASKPARFLPEKKKG